MGGAYPAPTAACTASSADCAGDLAASPEEAFCMLFDDACPSPSPCPCPGGRSILLAPPPAPAPAPPPALPVTTSDKPCEMGKLLSGVTCDATAPGRRWATALTARAIMPARVRSLALELPEATYAGGRAPPSLSLLSLLLSFRPPRATFTTASAFKPSTSIRRRLYLFITCSCGVGGCE